MATVGNLIAKRALVTLKVESTYGTDSTPAGPDAIMAHDVKWQDEIAVEEVPAATTYLGDQPHAIGSYFGKLSFRAMMRASGAAGTAPKVWRAMLACGHANTNVGATSDSLKPDSTFKGGYTIYVYIDGILKKFTGCVGNFKLAVVANKVVWVDFEFQGIYNALSDTAFPGSIAFDTTVASLVARGMTLSWGSFTPIFKSLTIESGNVIEMREDGIQASGVYGFTIVDRKPKGTLVVEHELVANRPWAANAIANAGKVLDVTIGTGAGARIDIDAPDCRKEGATTEGNILTTTIPFRLYGTADDQYTIKAY